MSTFPIPHQKQSLSLDTSSQRRVNALCLHMSAYMMIFSVATYVITLTLHLTLQFI